ncbi:S41 family peptidase [Fluviicola taffensis]|nr:S41 family peptidase [Fluviicola taffensis]
MNVNSQLFAQTLSKNEKLATLCKAWGVLKYQHPLVVKGHFDWDKVLIEKIGEVEKVKDLPELRQFYSKWIDELKNYKPQKKNNVLLPEQKVMFSKWEADSIIYGTNFINEVHEMMLMKRNPEKMFYVTQAPAGQYLPKNENTYSEMTYPNESFRLLGLFRYWNVIEYFYPIKEDLNWDASLIKYIPLLIHSKSQIEYYLVLNQLIVEIQDGHAYLHTPFPKMVSDHLYKYQIPYVTKRFEDFAIVTRLHKGNFDYKLAVGDKIIAVDGIKINDVLNKIKVLIPVSNEDVLLESAHPLTFSGNTDNFQVTIIRDNDTLDVVVKRYLIEEFHFDDPVKNEVVKIINDSVVYVDPREIGAKEFVKVLKDVKQFKSLIIDMRGYPLIRHHNFTNFISPNARKFLSLRAPKIDKPGTFFEFDDFTGKKNKNYYKGNIFVLVNRYTKSASEHTCMAMQAYDNVKIVGTTTSGSDGNVADIIFPGNVETIFSGLNVIYPNGISAQHAGVKIDYKVDITPEDEITETDKILKEAIRIANGRL